MHVYVYVYVCEYACPYIRLYERVRLSYAASVSFLSRSRAQSYCRQRSSIACTLHVLHLSDRLRSLFPEINIREFDVDILERARDIALNTPRDRRSFSFFLNKAYEQRNRRKVLFKEYLTNVQIRLTFPSV